MTLEPRKFRVVRMHVPLNLSCLPPAPTGWPRVSSKRRVLTLFAEIQMVNKLSNAENALIDERRMCEALSSDLERLQRVSPMRPPVV